MPVYSWLRQFTRSPLRQNSQYPQEPPRKPTPTRCPTAQPWTPGPRASIRPTTSCPGTRGQRMGKRPSTVPESEWHTPQASTRMRTCWGPGSSSGFLTSENCPGFETSIALYVAFISPPTAFDSDAARGRALLQVIIDVDVQELPPCWGSKVSQRC